MTGKCGSVTVRLIPAPRGTSIVAAGVSKKLLQMAGMMTDFCQALSGRIGLKKSQPKFKSVEQFEKKANDF